MTEPLITIVDEENNYVREGTRHEVHEGGLWHQAIHCLIQNKSGEIYLSIRDDIVAMDQYDVSLTEHVRGGESFQACAERGLRNRLGVAETPITPLSEVFRESDPHPGNSEYGMDTIMDNRYMQIFGVEYDGPIVPDKRIYSGGTWMEVSDVSKLVENNPDSCASHFIKDWNRVKHHYM